MRPKTWDDVLRITLLAASGVPPSSFFLPSPFQLPFPYRVKGRDYYDFLFYSARDTPINMRYLEAKLRDSGHYEERATLGEASLTEMLARKFRSVDFDKVRDDVRPLLIADKVRSLDDWGPELFIALAHELRAEVPTPLADQL